MEFYQIWHEIQGQILIHPILRIPGLIDSKLKWHESFKWFISYMTMTFDLAYDFDPEFSRWKSWNCHIFEMVGAINTN